MYIVKIINKCIFVSKLINRLWKYLFLVFMIYLCMDIFNKVIKKIIMDKFLIIDIYYKVNIIDIM